jgi:PIN domain nuclease of toxin-antitoxin system
MGRVRVLVDTHVWLWMWGEPRKLRSEARDVLEDSSTTIVVSAVSAWEIAVKEAAGRLRLPGSAATWLADTRHLADVEPLSITFAHAARAGALPPIHRDPFDRMLVAQAQIDHLVIATADPRVAAYEVDTLRA